MEWGRRGGEWKRKSDSVESQYNSEENQEYWSIVLINHNQDFTFHFEMSVNHTARLMRHCNNSLLLTGKCKTKNSDSTRANLRKMVMC